MNRIILILFAASISFSSLEAKQVTVPRTPPPSSFRLKHDRTVSAAEIRAINKLLESTYVADKKRTGLEFNGRQEVIFCNTLNRFQSELHGKVFNDAAFRDKKIYICLETYRTKVADMPSAMKRVVARALLDQLPGCPQWFSECYGIMQSEEYTRFDQPIRVNVSSLADLSEDLNHSERAEDAKEVFAKIAYTAHFFMERYGLKKIETLFPRFRRGEDYEDAFAAVFGEKLADIEHAWVEALHSRLQK